MLCGPTAVGKSTLINALAGADIARPGLGATTRAAMLYIHEEDDPARLFEYSHALGRNDQQETEIVRHRRDELLHKVLVDTPDIDSVRLEHKELTGRLVHAADLVLFVTSPEKYKVMRSARWVLQQRQQRAMAFVLNKWDRETLGLQRDRRHEIVEDFHNVLTDEGFPDALVFTVSALARPTNNPGANDVENELPALRSWLETGISQSTANVIRRRRLRAAWGRLAAAIESVTPQPLSKHPMLPEITHQLAGSASLAEHRVNAEASILEPIGLEDAGWPATPGLLGMWAQTRHRITSTTASLRMGFAMFNPAAPTGGPPSSATAFGATSSALLSETTRQLVRETAAARIGFGPVETTWIAEISGLEQDLAQLPLDVATEIVTAANRPTVRRFAGIASIYAIEGIIILVLLTAVGRIGLDFIFGTYAPASLFMTVVELVSILLIIGNITANMFFPPLRQRMRRTVAQRAKSIVRSTLERIRKTLHDHVEAVDRLAREGRDLLLVIDRAVMALTLPGGGEADTGRLFGQPPKLRLAAEATAEQLPPQPKAKEAEARELVARRPSFD